MKTKYKSWIAIGLVSISTLIMLSTRIFNEGFTVFTFAGYLFCVIVLIYCIYGAYKAFRISKKDK